MCGRLSQYRGIHDFVETLSLPEAWRNNVGDQPLGRYNVAPTTPVAVLRVDEVGPRADQIRWAVSRVGQRIGKHLRNTSCSCSALVWEKVNNSVDSMCRAVGGRIYRTISCNSL